MKRPLAFAIGRVLVATMALIGVVALAWLIVAVDIPPYWFEPRSLAWLFVGTLYIASAIYLALDEISGATVPTHHWLALLAFGGLVLLGVNRRFFFSSDWVLFIFEYALVFAALILWGISFSLIIAVNEVPPVRQRLRGFAQSWRR